GPLQSIAQFRSANLAGSGFLPLVTYTAGESRAHPQIGTDTLTETWPSDRSTLLDHTWLANEALWDQYFLSTIADQTSAGFGRSKSRDNVMQDFFKRTARLPNQRFTPYNPGSTDVPGDLQSASEPERRVAAHLFLNGGFNVNCTSEDAWVAVLSSLREMDVETSLGNESGAKGTTPFPRMTRPTGGNIDRNVVQLRENVWEGYRSLTDGQIQNLAKEIVVEIRKRGPFLSLADFVNRGIGSDEDESNISGAIQAAIDRLDLNRFAESDGIDLDAALLAEHDYKSTRAAIGTGYRNTATHSPGAISQGDILTGLGSRITVRSDTFRIRAYGEALDRTGKKVEAKAWCEAIVQRVPDYVDPVDAPSVIQEILDDGSSGTANQMFGRRYQVLSFRWLAADEV
ncbi:MAG: hypothetical protein KDN05_15145, partial [Verrucomicrobiae bacterium]|nr:hypothetical protein [Verrucomicrobiae bacterium]